MRIDKDTYYLTLARDAASRSTCLRRAYGAVIVQNGEIIATGYNGAPRGRCNCSDRGICERAARGVAHGERYELCRSVHAEMNAIISASRRDMMGATLYLNGIDMETGEDLTSSEPCDMCKRVIINAGIREVVLGGTNGIRKVEVREYVENE